MEFVCSPSRDAQVTLRHSPTHLHHVDTPMARTLRRSLSRSPSKITLARLPTPLRTSFYNTHTSSGGAYPSLESSAEDFQLPSAKKPRPTLRRTSPLSSMSHGKPSRSTMQRALSDASDNANSNPPSSSGNSGDGQENLFPSSPGSVPGVMEENQEDLSPSRLLVPSKPLRLIARAPIFRPANQEWRTAKSSPLKRSDAVMNFSLEPPGSPSAKRRTVCGGIASPPLVIMRDQSQSDRDPTSSDDDIPALDVAPHPLSNPRPLSIRRPKSIGRFPENTIVSNRRGLESPRDSSKHSHAGSRRGTQSAAKHTSHSYQRDDIGIGCESNDTQHVHFARPMHPQPHPLSQALSPTSPTPTGRDDHFGRGGAHFDSPAIPALDFSKSLPIGALRPSEEVVKNHQMDSQQSSFESTFATPRLYHIARPDPTAFRSTGLISKKHRNPDDIPPPPVGHPDMPDTPCKRFPGTFTFSKSPTPTNSVAKEQRYSKPAFGTPSRPFNPHGTRPSSGSLGQSVDIFGSTFNNSNSNRRASILSFEGEEASNQCPTDSQSSADELPPTPTKQALLGASSSKQNSLRSSLFGRRPSVGPGIFVSPENTELQQVIQAEPSCKSHFSASNVRPDGNESRSFGLQPAVIISSGNSSQTASKPLATARRLRKHLSRAGTSPLAKFVSTKRSASLITAKKSSASAVFQSHSSSSADRGVPQTPVENALPDPSGLSISPGWKHPGSVAASTFSKIGAFPPATPTHRDGIAPLNFNRPIMTPSNHAFGHDVDPVLSYRFKKVEWYGKGQFSEVYKVFERRDSITVQSCFGSSSGSRSSQTSIPDRVYIVKKSKIPYTSMKIRQRKLREAAVMSALGKSDHIVHLVNSWEASGHMYIQTEFCEEGSLEQFLATAGNRGRLDDFRIWKILIELSEGLKHIHDCGFIHLDLKPANVFIDFAGILKIGDFGLASEWPAPANVEGEGDRRYIGPDLLQGAFDKPADIFALGMMMFEIAGNCELPDNGTYWQHLRSGNWSDLPSLTSTSSYSFRDDSQDGLITNTSRHTFEAVESLHSLHPASNSPPTSWQGTQGSNSPVKTAEDVTQPPSFMLDPLDPAALEQVVHWMMQPNPSDRPIIDQILEAGGCRWVDERRRAGAVVFEGPWGPPNHVFAFQDFQEIEHQDEEMLDAP